MTKVALFLTTLLMALTTQAQPQPRPAPMSCTPDEIQRISAEAERATLDRVRMDLRAEGRAQGYAMGYTEQECLDRATEVANRNSFQAIDDCTRQTTYFRNCQISHSRVILAPAPLRPSIGQGMIDEKGISEETCRREAENRAISAALALCQSDYGTRCRIVSGPAPATHQVERRRRYGIAGPKEDYHICQSSAQALPDSGHRFQCGVEIIAQVRP